MDFDRLIKVWLINSSTFKSMDASLTILSKTTTIFYHHVIDHHRHLDIDKSVCKEDGRGGEKDDCPQQNNCCNCSPLSPECLFLLLVLSFCNSGAKSFYQMFWKRCVYWQKISISIKRKKEPSRKKVGSRFQVVFRAKLGKLRQD